MTASVKAAGKRIAAAIAATPTTALLVSTMLLAVSAQLASAQPCGRVGSQCGALVKQGCLARLGAGSEALPEETCGSQFDAYRGCLAEAARACSPSDRTDGALLASLTDALCAVGVWTGPVVEPGASSYTMRLEVGIRNDVYFARTFYPALKCSGRGDFLSGPKNRRVEFREVITKNRTRCADGRFAVTCMADGRLHWRWRRDNGEYFDAILTR